MDTDREYERRLYRQKVEVLLAQAGSDGFIIRVERHSNTWPHPKMGDAYYTIHVGDSNEQYRTPAKD